MIIGQPVNVMIERIKTHGGKNTRLPHGAADMLLDPPGLFDDAAVWTVTPVEEGVLAAGQSRGEAAIWTSVDCLNWIPVELDLNTFGASSIIYDVLEHDGIILAVGESSGSGAIWMQD